MKTKSFAAIVLLNGRGAAIFSCCCVIVFIAKKIDPDFL
jgi:hypothetical protein